MGLNDELEWIENDAPEWARDSYHSMDLSLEDAHEMADLFDSWGIETPHAIEMITASKADGEGWVIEVTSEGETFSVEYDSELHYWESVGPWEGLADAYGAEWNDDAVEASGGSASK